MEEFEYLEVSRANGTGKSRTVQLRGLHAAGPSGERGDSGIVCDRELPFEVNDRSYETVVKPATMYECRAINIRNKNESLRNENAKIDVRRSALRIIQINN